MPNKILIADDHAITRVGIKSLIVDNLSVDKIDEADGENEIISKVKSIDYDLIILDINMPESDFVHLMKWLEVKSPQTAILVFTMHPEDIYGKHAMQLGARGFINKRASDKEILIAIQKVLNGELYINKTLSQILKQSKEEIKISNPFSSLSAREMEIALLLKKEHSVNEICDILNIQYSTANTYKRRIFEKLNVHNTTSLTRLMHTYNMEEN